VSSSSETSPSEKDLSREKDLSKERLGRFGAALRAARQREDLIQAEVASAVGISRQYLSSIEQGEAEQLSLRVAWALCDALGLRAPVDLGMGPLEMDPLGEGSADLEAGDAAEPGVPPPAGRPALAGGVRGGRGARAGRRPDARRDHPPRPPAGRAVAVARYLPRHRSQPGVIVASLEEHRSPENRSAEH